MVVSPNTSALKGLEGGNKVLLTDVVNGVSEGDAVVAGEEWGSPETRDTCVA